MLEPLSTGSLSTPPPRARAEDDDADDDDPPPLAWVAAVADDHVTLHTVAQVLQVRTPTGAARFTRGQVVVLNVGEGGGKALRLETSDHISLAQLQEFMHDLFGARPAATTQDKSTETEGSDGPSALFAEELLRCAANPARCETSAHLMQTVRRLSVLRERLHHADRGVGAETSGGAQSQDDEAWASCMRAAVGAEAANGARGSSRKRARAADTDE
tara:strand:+ start:2869 stop:3516 length:648 start_codon:yes stop_codon:yes gene_type:complete